MNPHLFYCDMNSEQIQRKIRKNESVARDALKLIARRHRNLEPQDAFEQVANTIGIMAANLVRDGNGLMGRDMAILMRDLVKAHMDRQIDMIGEGAA